MTLNTRDLERYDGTDRAWWALWSITAAVEGGTTMRSKVASARTKCHPRKTQVRRAASRASEPGACGGSGLSYIPRRVASEVTALFHCRNAARGDAAATSREPESDGDDGDEGEEGGGRREKTQREVPRSPAQRLGKSPCQTKQAAVFLRDDTTGCVCPNTLSCLM